MKQTDIVSVVTAYGFDEAQIADLLGKREVATISIPMDFDRGIRLIQQLGTVSAEAPENIAETTIVRTVRFGLEEGSLLVTCSRPDRKVSLTKSPHSMDPTTGRLRGT